MSEKGFYAVLVVIGIAGLVVVAVVVPSMLRERRVLEEELNRLTMEAGASLGVVCFIRGYDGLTVLDRQSFCYNELGDGSREYLAVP